MTRVSLRRLITRYRNFIDRPSGKILIIGEKPGNRAPAGRIHVPFLSTKFSSGWLNQQLDAWQIDEAKLVWLNAFSLDDEPLTRDDILNLRPSRVICLGTRASALLTRLGIEHQAFHHPQFHRRFLSKRPYPLLAFLKELLNES